jgi:hypothetical protein
MYNKLNQLLHIMKRQFGLIMGISLGIFLFILFFQPFPVENFDFNNRLIFVAGLATIIFIFTVMVRVFAFLQERYKPDQDINLTPVSFMNSFVHFALCSLAFTFYLRYVGSIRISFFIMLKVSVICLAPPVLIILYEQVINLKQLLANLLQEKTILLKQLEKYEENSSGKSVELLSENGTDTIKLLVADVAFIRSADNYVEIVFKEDDVFKKRLIRNTMKGIEQQVKPYGNFIRCHRICIVNAHYVEKLYKSKDHHWVIIKGWDEKIPVSRQHLLKLKETL